MLQVFSFQSKEIRCYGTWDRPIWIAQEVCNCLELQGDAGQHTRRLDEDEKVLISIQTPGGFQDVLGVTEPGLYNLVLGCRKPVAKDFKRWITHEVLPSIRKTGEYKASITANNGVADKIAELNMAEQLLLELGIEPIIAKQLKIDNAIAFLPNAKPMLEAGKKLASAEDPHEAVGLTPTQIGNKLNPKLKPQNVNQILQKLGFQTQEISGKKKFWQLTESGEEHGYVYFATGKEKQWSGDQIRWQVSVIGEIEKFLTDAIA
jgi:prophage antirepressor-like protein